MYNVSILANCLSSVYRLEEDGGLLQEGGVSLPVLLLRACSYKTKSEGRHQGNAPILFKGWMSVFVNPKKTNPCKSVRSVGNTTPHLIYH